MSLIPTPAWSEDLMSQFFDTTMKEALSHGLTSIHDADSRPDHIALFKKFGILLGIFSNTCLSSGLNTGKLKRANCQYVKALQVNTLLTFM